MTRRFHVIGNWKLHHHIDESRKLARAVLDGSRQYLDSMVVGVAPVHTTLWPVHQELLDRPENFWLVGQSAYHENEGAFTGAVSYRHLKDAGCDAAIVGHSERRRVFRESDEEIMEQLESAIRAQLHVIYCIGETKEEREQGRTLEVIERQLGDALKHVPPSGRQAVKFIVAYEPVWAIGTGVNATPEQVQEVHSEIRRILASRWTDEEAVKVPILYGGSLKPSNAREIFEMPDVDGGLVGGASLKAETFLELVRIAAEVMEKK